MKRMYGWIVPAMILTLCTACGQETADRYDEGYQAGYANAESQYEKGYQAGYADALTAAEKETAESVTISGSFTATVRDVIPDYCYDNTTLSVAVVTCYQDGPFALFVGEELAATLKVGEIYVFEIQEKTVQGITEALYDHDPKAAVPHFNLRISSVRLAEEGDYGVISSHLTYEAKPPKR